MDVSLVIEKMQEYFDKDQKRIDHALGVADFAEKILTEEQADRDIVLAAAYLHDIGIHEAERKYGSSGGKYQEIEGPPIARKILQESGWNEDAINNICNIIAKHHTFNGLVSKEFQVLFEADWIVNLDNDFRGISEPQREKVISKNFKTRTGINLVRGRYKKAQNTGK